MRTVLFVSEGMSSAADRALAAQTLYRCRLPALGLNRAGWSAFVTSGMVERADGRLQGVIDAKTGTMAPVADTVVLRMVSAPGTVEMVKSAREAGQLVVYDIDDPVCWLEPDQPAYGHVDVDAIFEVLRACERVLVSTPAIAEMVREGCHPLGAPPAMVCRNAIDARAYAGAATRRERTGPGRGRLRIGWPGRTSHRGGDLAMIAPSVRRVLAEHSGTEFFQLGRVEGDRPLGELVWSPTGTSDGRVRSEPWVGLDELPAAFSEFDLALLPQRPSRFAEARSAVTGLAMAAAGVPFISSRTSEYQRLVDEGIGWLADGDDRRDKIAWALRGDRLDEMRRRARVKVTALHDIRAAVRAWQTALS